MIYALGVMQSDYANLSDDDRTALRLVFSRWYGAFEFDEACRVAAETLKIEVSRDAG